MSMALSHEQTTFETKPHCVVLVSGGIDSAACINFLQRQEFTVSGALSEEIRRSEFSAADKELGGPKLTPLGKCSGAVELEMVP